MSTQIEPTARIGSADLSDVADAPRLLINGIRALWSGAYVAGPAFTVQTPPGDHRSVFDAIMAAEAGDVLVIDAGGGEDRAVFGEITALAAMQRGIAGVVVNGLLRDSDAIRQLAFPAFGRGTVPTAPRPRIEGPLRLPLTIGGNTIWQGDYVIGDGDGVVVVSPSDAATSLSRARDLIEYERGIADALRAGAPITDFTAQLRKLNEGDLDGRLVEPSSR